MKHRLTIGVLGLGHVGLPTAVGFADLGLRVIGADDDDVKADLIRAGIPPFYEPGLHEILTNTLSNGSFQVAESVKESISKSDVIFVCVGTPQNNDGSADLSQIEIVGRMIAAESYSDKLVVEKSTTPVSTAQKLKESMREYARDSVVIEVAVNPEFLREGTGLRDFFNPERIVLGVESERARSVLVEIYASLIARMSGCLEKEVSKDNERFVITDLNTAELIKHASNSFLATKISFINTVADICEKVGADVAQVSKGMGMDPRIGSSFLNAGMGFGGYCLPKDIKAFYKIGDDLGVDMSIFKSVTQINEARPEKVIDKLRESLGVLAGKTIAIWGLSFKPETDDVRESPSISLVEKLLDEKTMVRLHDPESSDNFASLFPVGENIAYHESPEEAATSAHAVVIATEWGQYREVDFANLYKSMSCPLILDVRNMLDAQKIIDMGFLYRGTGRYSSSDTT